MMLTLEMSNLNIKETFGHEQNFKYPSPISELSATMATSEKVTEEVMKEIADGRARLKARSTWLRRREPSPTLPNM